MLDVEADLVARFAARAGQPPPDGPRPELLPAAARRGWMPARPRWSPPWPATDALVVVEGAAGAGKTTTLAATRGLLERQGRRLMVVTPTLKAAKVAARGGRRARRVGGVARLRTRLALERARRLDPLAVGEVDPVTGRIYTRPATGARLRPGDLLVVDEAGMLDQDTARALLTVADESRAPGRAARRPPPAAPRSAAAASSTSPPTRSTRPPA